MAKSAAAVPEALRFLEDGWNHVLLKRKKELGWLWQHVGCLGTLHDCSLMHLMKLRIHHLIRYFRKKQSVAPLDEQQHLPNPGMRPQQYAGAVDDCAGVLGYISAAWGRVCVLR